MRSTLLTVLSILFILPNIEAQDVTPYPDNSFDTATYVYLGIPAISKTWTTKELKQYVNYMQKIYNEDKWSLPRKDSPTSGLLFSKMIDDALLAPILDKNTIFSERIDYINSMMEYTNFISSIYHESDRKTERFGREVLTTYAFMMQFTRTVRQFMDELKNTLPKDITAQADFIQMYDGSTQQVFDLLKNALVSLKNDTKRYNNPDLSDFARQTAKATTQSWKLFNNEQQQQILKELKSLRKHEIKAVRKEAKQLIKQVK